MKYVRWFFKAVRPYSLSLAVMIFAHVLLAGCAICFVYSCKMLVDSAVAAFSGASTESITAIFSSIMTYELYDIPFGTWY